MKKEEENEREEFVSKLCGPNWYNIAPSNGRFRTVLTIKKAKIS